MGNTIRLSEKLTVAVPRYTSYPTALEFNEDFGTEQWVTAIAGEKASKGRARLSLYVHIPFCSSLCYFCACNKVILRDRTGVAEYLAGLGAELKLYRQILGANHRVEQMHWGGGTPNFLTESELAHVYDACRKNFAFADVEPEISIEIDPRTVTASKISAISALGFNRASLGVQDFAPEVQSIINRIQSFELTRNVCEQFRNSGISDINIDLIYGLPAQSERSFERTLSQVIEIRPARIALYGYAHVTWLKKVQKSLERAPLPSPRERLRFLLMARERLSDAGYLPLGIDHFALPGNALARAFANGGLNRNFMGYTTKKGLSVLGVGLSSISTFDGAFAQNEKAMGPYLDSLARGRLPVARGVALSADDKIRAAVISDFLCKGEIDCMELSDRFGISFSKYFADCAEEIDGAADDGLIEIRGTKIVLTERGLIFGRNVAAIFDKYLKGHRESSAPKFSQAV